MIEHRPAASLGHADHGWLSVRHHFSFAAYHDPSRMGWGLLRVLNDDTIAAGAGFPSHAHADMEIVTLVMQGAITHEDSLGYVGRTAAGAVQVMSAGTGLRHAEWNHEAEATRLLQLWIRPREEGAPRWASRAVPRGEVLSVLASGDAADIEALPLRADARVLGVALKAGERATYPAEPARHIYLVATRGRVSLGGRSDLICLETGDAAAITGETALSITALETADLILVDTA